MHTQVPEEGVICSSGDIVQVQMSDPPTPVALFENVAVRQLSDAQESGATNMAEL